MICIQCKQGKTQVVNSRQPRDRHSVWRRRACLVCHAVFTTLERYDYRSTNVKKTSGQSEPFSLFKLQISLMKALAGQNRQIEAEELALTVCALLPWDKELSSQDIKDIAQTTLNNYDHSAGVRYGSF